MMSRRTAVYLGLLAAFPVCAQSWLLDGTISPVYEEDIVLNPLLPVTIRTRNLSPGADSVLHLLNAAGAEVAFNDNYGSGSGSRIYYTPMAGGVYKVVLRARGAGTAGTCDLYFGTRLHRSGVRLGGWNVSFLNVQPGEQIETVELPNGPSERHRLYVLQGSTQHIARRVAGGGTGAGALFTVTAPGAYHVIAGVATARGPARIFRNDAARPGHDLDGDGLGSQLEAYIGTCSTLSGMAKGFDCAAAADARDTDGDGLSDALELRGRRDRTPHQLLPRWGADPRHKDVFFEVDYMRRRSAETEQRMTAQQARQFASYYEDQIAPLPSAEQAAIHARSLLNPDGKPGIHIHLDTGVPTQSPTDATLYGDWGGYNSTAPVTEGVGVDYTTAWQDNMEKARWGVFRYMLPYDTGEGSNPVGYACASGLNNIEGLAHECSHALGLWSHSLEPAGSPDANCKPNHPSLIDYAYSYKGVGFADGLNRGPLNNAHLSEWNAVDPANERYIEHLKRIFNYRVQGGNVDWDRNGVFEPEGRYVRAYANSEPGGSCEYTRYNQLQVPTAVADVSPAVARLGDRIYAFWVDRHWPTGVSYRYSNSAWNCSVWVENQDCGSWTGSGGIGFDKAIMGIDAALLGDQLVLVAIDIDGALWRRVLTVNGNVETWSSARPVVTSGAAGEPSLTSDGARLLLVFRTMDAHLRYAVSGAAEWPEAKEIVSADGTSLTAATYVSPAAVYAHLKLNPSEQPGADTKGFFGAFADVNGMLDLWHFDSTADAWRKTPLLWPRPGPAAARPALAYVPRMTCCDGSGNWQISSENGTIYMLYARKSDLITRMRISFTARRFGDMGGPFVETIGHDADYDNQWWAAHGIDLLADYDRDNGTATARNYGSLFALAAVYSGDARFDHTVWLRPRSDGLLDYTYGNKDDWAILGAQLCTQLRAVEPVPPPAITCPAFP